MSLALDQSVERKDLLSGPRFIVWRFLSKSLQLRHQKPHLRTIEDGGVVGTDTLSNGNPISDARRLSAEIARCVHRPSMSPV
jgi:hypothetical protein